MPIIPKIPQNQKFQTKKCNRCDIVSDISDFCFTHSIFYKDNRLPICNSCINDYLRANDYSWDSIDKICQWADIPFIVKEWVRLEELNGKENTWPVYAQVFSDDCYTNLGWSDYFKQYQKLREVGMLEDEIPLIDEAKFNDLRRKWGANYSNEELIYLEDLYKGLKSTQNINGALQIDQAQKICKLSLEIDSRIRAGDKDVDKFLSSYDKLVKTAEFTPKNTKNAIDFDSFAEVGFWLEKRGKQNKFYDGTTRDIIDETLKNIENYNQRLYINEGGIGEEITERLQALNASEESEDSIYDLANEYDLDEYDNAGYTLEEEQEEFIVDEGDDNE